MQTASIFSFHGGIHPPENKAQSLTLPLGRPNLPSELILPLSQHIGQSSRPLVSQGDKVLKGQTIAMNNGFLSSFLHAPTSGSIKAIEERAIAHPSGLRDLCIVIEPDGADSWTERTPFDNWHTASKTDVLAYLAEMGIVGMGGAGFPTQVKLQGAHKHPLTHFIINAAECEPYITADDMLIREKTEQLILGIEVLQHIVEADNVVIGIEDNKPKAIAALNDLLRHRNSHIQVAVVPTKYPSGGEKQLIQLLTGKEVPSGQHPADIGILCQNVGTCVAVHDAIFLGQPLISRFTTLTGDALKAPQNVEVLLGTPVEHLLDYAQAMPKKISRLVMGGPMMGFTLNATDVPIVKTSNCILAATKKELPAPAPEQACIRCGMCEQACPANLLPQQLLWFSKSQEFEKAEHYNLFDCIECGACSYVCPSSIPLVQYYRHSKSSIREAREATVKSDLAKQRYEARKARQEAEAAEKEAKRLARQKASSKTAEAKKAAPTTSPSSTSTAAAPAASDESKKLKVDVAIGKTKLKKLQKQLLEAQENEHTEDIDNLQLQVTEQEKALALLEKQLEEQLAKIANTEAATEKTVAKAPVNDALKKAKIDVALIGTKLKKAQKQLADSPEDDALKAKVAEFERGLADAQAQLATLSTDTPLASAPEANTSHNAPVKTAVSDELKKAKIDVALIGVKLKKAQKQLAESPDDDALKSQISELEVSLKDAQTRLDSYSKQQASTNKQNTQTEQTNSAANLDDLKKLKIDTAIAKAAVKKVEKALKKAEEMQAPEIDTLRQQLTDAQQRADNLEKALANPNTQTQTPTAKPAEPTSSSDESAAKAEQIKKQKIASAMAKASINKLKKRLTAEPDQADSIQQEIAAAEKKQQEADALLTQLTQPQDNT